MGQTACYCTSHSVLSSTGVMPYTPSGNSTASSLGFALPHRRAQGIESANYEPIGPRTAVRPLLSYCTRMVCCCSGPPAASIAMRDVTACGTRGNAHTPRGLGCPSDACINRPRSICLSFPGSGCSFPSQCEKRHRDFAGMHEHHLHQSF